MKHGKNVAKPRLIRVIKRQNIKKIFIFFTFKQNIRKKILKKVRKKLKFSVDKRHINRL